eukprot:s3346_g9.t1
MKLVPSTLGQNGYFWVQWLPLEAMKEKVDQLHKRMYLQHDGLDKKVQEVLLKVELGDRGINSQGLERLARLPERNQMLGSMEGRNSQGTWELCSFPIH